MATDEQLIGHLVRGDEFALKALYDRHGKALYALALRITGDAGSAEELLQDTFFQLWRKASQFDAARGSLVGWLLAITRRRAISHVRCKKNQQPYQSSEDTGLASPVTGSVILERQIACQLISAALERLPKPQRDAVTLAYFDGLTCEEIAINTRTPLGTIKSRLRSGLKVMSRTLSTESLTGVKRPSSRRAVTLETVLITNQLFHRACRSGKLQWEATCLRALRRDVSTSPDRLIESFLKIAMELCGAGTTGLSLLETTSTGDQIFKWTHLTGTLAKHVGGTTPRNFSPCGVTLDRNSPQLFSYPERYFEHLSHVGIPIVEGLVIPFHVGRETEGTIWIVSHEEDTRFNAEHARIMTSLAEFTGCALHLRLLQSRTADGNDYGDAGA